jgi:MoxR-like ATPase
MTTQPLPRHHTFEKIAALQANVERVIRGKSEVVQFCIAALLARGHILLEDVPGVGKTTLAHALARSLSLSFQRIQFTSDLLPSDIVGVTIYNQDAQEFEFISGPVFTNILLADEINRASPRTQSSLLEAMSERQASIEGTTHPLPAPFQVIATQNPIEFHGTYPLPEAQLDRFAMRINLGYPDKEHEVDVLFSQYHHHPLDDVHRVVDAASILAVQESVRAVRVERGIARYLVALADASRRHPSVKMGCSPRGTLILFRMAQARAFLDGRDHAVPEDVKAVALPTLAHRLALDTKAKYACVQKEDVVRELLDSVPVGD